MKRQSGEGRKPGAIVAGILAEVSAARPRGAGPVVLLSWAQTVNSVIGARAGGRLTLSSAESLALVHRIRSLHAAILVGIGTVLADDPLLSVRLVEGPQPRPIVLDSHLRTPLESKLLGRADMKPWIFHGDAPGAAGRALEERGARLFRVGRDGSGLDLGEALAILEGEGVGSLMVEGGAAVLESFAAAGLARHAVVTIAPTLTAGLSVFHREGSMPRSLRFTRCLWEAHGGDMVMWGTIGP